MTPPDRTPYRVAGAGSDLLPCPWCAGEPTHCENHRGPSMFWVLCRACHASPGDRPSRAEAITAWNTRALSAPSPSADALRPGEWEPIETAPKDGRHILLFGTQDRMEGLHIQGQFAFSGYWDDIDGSWCSAGSTWVGPFYRPTHWQPLPAPPKTPLNRGESSREVIND